MWKKCLLALVVNLVGCGTGIDNITKQACVGVGFSADQVSQLSDAIKSWPEQGISFDEATLFAIKVARDLCGDTDECLALRGCLELAVQAAYHRDQSGQTVALNLKLPLPGGKSWLLTTEAGGGDCASSVVDVNHTDKNYYSLDFAPVTQTNGIVRTEVNVPILAMADGQVLEVAVSKANGNYIVVDHGNGFSGRYLHLQSPSGLSVGASVKQGRKLGVMGATGEATGVHVHIGLRYNNDGSQGISQLAQVVLEGLPLTSYKTNCGTNGQRTSFYPSSNLAN